MTQFDVKGKTFMSQDASAQGLKIILFFALLFITLASCGIPILVLDCLMRKAARRPPNEESETEVIYTATDSEATHIISTSQRNSITSPVQKKLLQVWMARISCLAGGVFLAAGFLDLLPDVIEAFETAKNALKIETDYPLPTLVTLLGFFLILTIEQVVSVIHQGHSHNGHHHHHQNFNHADDSMSVGSIEEVAEHNFFKTVTLLVAISMHSIFEGLAVGLQATYAQVLSIFLALILHKIIIGISIGINLATLRVKTDTSSDVPRKKSIIIQVVSSLIFSFASPIGVLIGWALIQETQSATLMMTTAVLQGLACGTFLFVIFCEILPDQFRDGSPDRLIKLLFVFLGFVLIAVYIYFMPG